MLETALRIMLEKKLVDKVNGRRNWAVITYDNHYYKLGWGEAKRRCLLSWYLSEMAEHNISIYAFTYKKDCEECEKTLVELGYTLYN